MLIFLTTSTDKFKQLFVNILQCQETMSRNFVRTVKTTICKFPLDKSIFGYLFGVNNRRLVAGRKSYLSKNLSGKFGISKNETFPDKSLSHRSIIIPSIAMGVSEISNLLEGDDVLHTIDSLRLAGVHIEKQSEKWLVYGKGLNSLLEPTTHLYLGNSGTSTRLLAGLFAPYAFQSFFTGDASLSKRPMKRLFKPLEQMGVRFNATLGGTPPFSMEGGNIMPIHYEMEVASAQVKSAIILAACQIQGKTTIIEKVRTRNHTENMLKGCGGEIFVENTQNGDIITINGGRQLLPMNITIPNDPSSASFLVATAVLCEGSNITVENVCVNKTRTGFFHALIQMGANLEFTNKRTICGEEIADISAQYSPNLKGIELSGENSASMIDEYPILFVICAFANGVSVLHGLEELTAKESNRLKIMEENLLKIGVQCKANYEDFSIQIVGNPQLNPKCNEELPTQMDHRIAMSCFIAGLKSESGIAIDDDSYIKTSFPNFLDIMKKLNAKFN